MSLGSDGVIGHLDARTRDRVTKNLPLDRRIHTVCQLLTLQKLLALPL